MDVVLVVVQFAHQLQGLLQDHFLVLNHFLVVADACVHEHSRQQRQLEFVVLANLHINLTENGI